MHSLIIINNNNVRNKLDKPSLILYSLLINHNNTKFHTFTKIYENMKYIVILFLIILYD